MKNFTKKFSAKESALLKNLIGQEFRFIGGPIVPDYLVTDHFIIATSSFALSVHGDIHDSPFGEPLLDYSHFVARRADKQEVEATLASGNAFLEDQQSEITNVFLVRETINYKVKSVARRSYQSDVAIVLQLEREYLVLRLVSHSVEAIAAEMVEVLDLDLFESPSNAFQPLPFENYESQISLIAVSEI